jgi:PKD repeat protein
VPALLVAAIGCGDDDTTMAVDAATANDAGPVSDASFNSDAGPSLTFVDFSITGCEDIALDAGVADAGPTAPCPGAAPLTLRFTALAPAPVTVHAWSFGDGTGSDSRPSPDHMFELPGSYTVTLDVEGPSGTANIIKNNIVVAVTAPNGHICTLSSQCTSADCLCGDGATCPAGLTTGICTTDCSGASPCDTGEVCSDLAPTTPAMPAAWQRQVCLQSCAGGATCSDGLVCRSLRNGAGSGFVEGCFPADLLGDIGDSCVDEDGNIDDALCASGTCLDEGARGLCSADCSTDSCPTGSACATFVGGTPTPSCMANCDTTACDTDPWLACEQPGGAASKSFTVDETPVASGYCAPKSCSGAPDCGVDGMCSSGFCTAKP